MLINFMVFSSIKELTKADGILNLQPATCNLTILTTIIPNWG